MKTNITTMVISEKDAQAIMNKNNGNSAVLDKYEAWVGIHNGELMSINSNDENHYLYCYGVTTKQLRSDVEFISACLTNEDINHSLINLNYQDGKTAFCNWLQEFASWLKGESDVPPITSCGLYNYVCRDVRAYHLETLKAIATMVATCHDTEFSLRSVEGNRVSVEGYDEADAMDIIVADDGYTIQAEYYVRGINGERKMESPSFTRCFRRDLFNWAVFGC